MLNTNINQKLEFHSVSGLMCKSHPKSIICKAEENPYLLDMDNPRNVIQLILAIKMNQSLFYK